MNQKILFGTLVLPCNDLLHNTTTCTYITLLPCVQYAQQGYAFGCVYIIFLFTLCVYVQQGYAFGHVYIFLFIYLPCAQYAQQGYAFGCRFVYICTYYGLAVG